MTEETKNKVSESVKNKVKKENDPIIKDLFKDEV